MDTFIIKRDGKQEPFSIDKIKNAISKAFIASGTFATEETLVALLFADSSEQIACEAVLVQPRPMP